MELVNKDARQGPPPLSPLPTLCTTQAGQSQSLEVVIASQMGSRLTRANWNSPRIDVRSWEKLLFLLGFISNVSLGLLGLLVVCALSLVCLSVHLSIYRLSTYLFSLPSWIDTKIDR